MFRRVSLRSPPALLPRLARAAALACVALCVAGSASSVSRASSPRVSPARWDPAVGPPYQRLIERVAARHKLEPRLLAALVEVESARDAEAVSRAGAIGLAQLMPTTALRFGVEDITDPADNLDGGARYLAWLIRRFDGNLPLALAAYNAGEGAVDRYRGIPPYRETQGFVRRVLSKAGLSHLLTGSMARAGSPAAAPPRVEMNDAGSIVLTNVPHR